MRPPIRPRSRPPRPGRVLAPAALGVLLALAGWSLALPAFAATCAYDAGTATVTIAVADGESSVIARSGDAIALDGAPCDSATVTTTDTIVVNATGIPVSVTIDLGGGDFVPGQSLEADGGAPEIEFALSFPAGSPMLRVLGGGGADTMVVGAGGINLNAVEATGDADVVVSGLAAMALEGNAGNDLLSVAGGSGTGASTEATLDGGLGDDRLLGGRGGSSLTGGDGTDTADYGAAEAIHADLRLGAVSHAAGGTDRISGIENLVGSPGADLLIGDDAANAISGGDGDDRIDGGGGDDALDGSAGIDFLDFGPVDGGVQVDLRAGTSTGDGSDTLAGFENVMATRHADTIHGDGGPNRIAGGSGSDELFGHEGSDLLQGGKGNDQLFGQSGNDALDGGPGRDQLDGGRDRDSCRGGPDPDAFIFCEAIRLS